MKPILFNTDMVRAILDGRKAVTRRVVKPQPKSKLAYICMGYKCKKWNYPGEDTWKYWKDASYRLPEGLTDEDKNRYWTPPCNTDDILYVRETWAEYHPGVTGRYVYKASLGTENGDAEKSNKIFKWRPSIHMPKEAARIFLRVTGVRVERLQEITEDEARKEGAQPIMVSTDPENIPDEERTWCEWFPALPGFIDLWNSTIKPKDRALYGWGANPLVWVIEFERISREEAER